jgi:tetratricopeptide (TPR) repeat protein/KaiC/GvpD/RAD55 family RecA-like ATPase
MVADMLNVFLSYHWRDHDAVEKLAHAIKERGLNPFLDRWYLVPGRSWVQALEKVLSSCQAVAIFLGPNGMGRWQQREKDLALDRQAKDSNFPVIPILLPGADPALGFLSLNTWVDLRNGTTPKAIEILARAVRGEPPGVDLKERVAAAFATICPYRGLRPFREEDNPFFFGRESFTEQLVEAVNRRRLIAVVGASGSGKSSVVRAGLMPVLRRDRKLVWEVVAIVPQQRPMYSLAAGLLPFLEPELLEVDRLREIEKLSNSLDKGEFQLGDVIKRVLEKQPGTDRFLLIVDQWEELYTLCHDDDLRTRFIKQLLDATASGQCSVILSLRADFYGHVLSNRDLSDRLQDAVVNIGPMTVEELRCAIEEPAKKVGLRFEDGLVDRMLAEVGSAPGSLPLLEFLLTELWEKRRGGELSHEAYDEIGGVRKAIAARAEQAFERLGPNEKEAAHWALLALVVPGEGAEDTRRRATLAELTPLGRDVIAKLAAERLLVMSRDVAGREVVEVGHEALISQWDRLRQWVNDDREFVRAANRVKAEADLWDGQGRPDDFLLPSGRRLLEARDLLARPEAIFGLTRDYIESSIAAENKKQAAIEQATRKSLRTRQFAAGVTALFVASFVFAFLFAWQWKIALDQTRLAQEAFRFQLQTAQHLAQIAKDYVRDGRDPTMLLNAATGILNNPGLRESTVELRPTKINLLITIHDAYMNVGDTQRALETAREAQTAALELIGLEPANSSYQELVYRSCFRVADALVEQNKLDEARAQYDCALRIAKDFAGKDKSNVEWQKDLEFIHEKIGDLLMEQGAFDAAYDEYIEAQNIEERSTNTSDDDKDWRRRLAATYSRIGNVFLEKGDPDKAIVQFRRALMITKELADGDPENLGYQYTLSVRHSRMGATLLKLGDAKGAMAEFYEALRIRERLVTLDRDDTVYLNLSASSHSEIGDALLDKDVNAAIEHYQSAVQIREMLALKDHRNVSWQKLAIVRGKLDAALAKRSEGVPERH